MKRFVLLDTAPIPGTNGALNLFEYGEDFVIKIAGGDGGQLMNTRMHGSEDALAAIPCKQIANRPQVRVLIGGLGMGFTLASALQHLGADAEVAVAELVPGVVEWNRGPLGAKSGYPLNDPRAVIIQEDVAKVLQAAEQCYDAIMLDVDNGPEGLTQKGNDWLYSMDGLRQCAKALRPKGMLAVWSSSADRAEAHPTVGWAGRRSASAHQLGAPPRMTASPFYRYSQVESHRKIVGRLSVNLQFADAIVVQAAEVQVVAHRLHRGDHAQVRTAGVMQAADDLAVLVEGDGEAVRDRFRPQRARQFGQLRLEPGVAMEEVGVGLAWGRQCYPEGAVAVALQVVRQARQVVDEDVVLAGLVALEPVTGDAVAIGLVDQHEVLVRRQRHAVGEVQVFQQYAGFATGRVIAEQAAVRTGLEQVEQVVRLFEAR